MRSLIHRLHIILFVLSLACALSVINATYKQRHLFIVLEHAQNQAQQLRQEAARLQYQQGALSKTSRIESIALRQLAMEPVQFVQTKYVQGTLTASVPKTGVGPYKQGASVPPHAPPATKHAALPKKKEKRPASSLETPGNPGSLASPFFLSAMQIELGCVYNCSKGFIFGGTGTQGPELHLSTARIPSTARLQRWALLGNCRYALASLASFRGTL